MYNDIIAPCTGGSLYSIIVIYYGICMHSVRKKYSVAFYVYGITHELRCTFPRERNLHAFSRTDELQRRCISADVSAAVLQETMTST